MVGMPVPVPAHEVVTLHGGPCNGQTRSIRIGEERIMLEGFSSVMESDVYDVEAVPRMGSYSRVTYSHNEFEWDGWKS